MIVCAEMATEKQHKQKRAAETMDTTQASHVLIHKSLYSF